MNQAGLDCVTLSGNVVETELEKIDDNPKVATMVFKDRINEDDFEDNHLWNVVRQDDKYYLVDSSFLIEGEPVVREIEFDNERRNIFTSKLPDGRYRHYLSSGTIDVEQFK